jgi:hypothetical protein
MADFGSFTIVVAAVVTVATIATAWRHPLVALSFVILAIPLRDFSTRWMNVHTPLAVSQVTDLGRWWFVAILVLLSLCGVRWLRLRANRPLPRPATADVLLAAAVVLAIVAALTSPSFPAGFLSLRGYLQPLGVFLLARLITPTRNELRTLLIAWLAIGLIMAALGLWQVSAWTEADYRAEGYVRQDGDLVVPQVGVGSRNYLRPASTVSGPNELGMDMVVLILLAGLLALEGPVGARMPLAGLSLFFTAGLAISLSRSAFLGFVTALGAGVVLYRRSLIQLWTSASRRRQLALLLGCGLTLSAVVVILANSGILDLVASTIRSFGNQYHVLDSVRAVEYLLQRPQGVGMGLVEPKGALALIEAGGAYHVEGSIFQIGMEMGVWGLAAWLAFWGAVLARIYRNWHRLQSPELRVVAGTAFAGWLGSLVAFLFLPLMQSISLMVWLWFLLGVGYQSDRFEAEWNAAEQPAAVP